MSGTVFLGQVELSVEETGGQALVEVRRAGSLAGAVTVTFGITPDTATAGSDYTLLTSSATIPDGVASITVPVTILNDALAEGTEVMTFALISADGAALLAPRTTRISILDDEAPSPPPPIEPSLLSNHTLVTTGVVTGLNAPVRFTFNPADGSQVFIVEKGGVIRVSDLDTAQTTSSVFLDLSDRVNSAHDRGLLGIALHPDFANTPSVYVYYTVDPPEATGLSGDAGRDGAGNRFAVVERFTADAATGYTSVVPGSGVVLMGGAARGFLDVSGGGALDFTDPAHASAPASDRFINPADPNPPALVNGFKQDFIKADSRSHNGGAMVFGPDGYLYIATGDAVSFNYSDPRAVDVLSPHSLSGKILRIDPLTGEGAASNPFVTAGMDLDSNAAKVFQLGLRNPFSFAVADDGRVVIADVGQGSFEEINIAGPGANFGWPFFEGVVNGQGFRTPGYRDLPGAQAFYDAVAAGTITVTQPVAAFGHSGGDPGYRLQAIIGGTVVYDGPRYAAEFQNDFFFADFNTGNLFSTDVNAPSNPQFLGERQGIIHLEQGPDGWIYVANLFSGAIERLEITPAPVFAPPVQEIVAIGSATPLDAATQDFQLTPSSQFQVGGAVGSTRIDLRQDARFVFDYHFGNRDADGADGGGFALHDDLGGMRALGQPGGELGLIGLTRAIAIEFDTWNNGAGDIDDDHAVIFAPNSPGFGTGANGIVSLGNIEDGAWHRVEVTWTAATGTLAYSFDGVLRDSRADGIIANALGGSHFAHFLITGSTGGFSLEHRARLLAADVTFENIAAAQAPWMLGGFTREASFSENGTNVVLTGAATDAEGDSLTWSISGGPDAARFSVDAATGAVRFLAEPDFEAPTDANGDNRYAFDLSATDAGGLSGTQRVVVTVTDVVFEDVVGTAAGELLLGSARAERIIGLGGNDTIRAGDGDDTILATAGDGNDDLHGGAGAGDTYSLEGLTAAANVSLAAGRAIGAEIGNDRLRSIENAIGGAGHDTLTGDAGSNRLEGRDGNDILTGGDGDDVLLGGAGHDRLNGGSGADRLVGGSGDDLYWVDDIEDVVIEAVGEGLDTVYSTISWTLGEHVENLMLLDAAPLHGTGNALANRITGNAGANRLDGGAGHDRLIGGEGRDTLLGGDGNDVLVGGAGADLLTGGEGRDVFAFLALSDSPLTAFDTITDFVSGTDRVSVVAIDPSDAPGDQAFAFIGGNAFSGGGVAELRVFQSGGNTFAAFDVGNGGAAEMQLRFTGLLTLTAADFLL